MDGTIVIVAIYLMATFAAALVTGVAGFAFGLVAAAVWLHILRCRQTRMLHRSNVTYAGSICLRQF